MLQRAQILLDPQTKLDLEYVSSVTNQSISRLVRHILSDGLKIEKKKIKKYASGKKMSAVDTILKMADKAQKIAEKYGCDYPSDLSINHDHYLYGAPKKNA